MLDLQANLAGNRTISDDSSLDDHAPGTDLRRPPGGDPAGAAADRWRQLLDLDAALQGTRGVRLLTPEARVLLSLRIAGSLPVSAAILAAGTSHRGFYAVLDRLRAAGLVATDKDPDDQRVRRLSLDADAGFGA